MSPKFALQSSSQTAEQAMTPDGRPERRAHKRYVLGLAGGLSRDGQQFIPCRVRDFCPDGVLLDLDTDAGEEVAVGGQAVLTGDHLTLRFSISPNDPQQEHQARVRVVRTSDRAIGVSFDGENAEVVWQLRQLARQLQDLLRQQRDKERRARAPGAPMPVEQAASAGELLEAARDQMEQFLAAGMVSLFKEAGDQLVAGANEAGSDEEQARYLETMKEVKELKDAVETAYLGAMGGGFESMVNPVTARKSDETAAEKELALLDTGIFDGWLTTKNTISAAEGALKELQFGLEKRLTHLIRSPIDEENNPVGLVQLCLVFHDAIQGLGASHDARAAILSAFEQAVVKNLKQFYEDLNRVFINGGVLPVVERDKPIIRSSDSHTENTSRSRKAEEHKQPQDVQPESQARVATENTVAAPPDSGDSDMGAADSGAAAPDQSDAGADSISRTPTLLPPLKLGNAFRAAGNLINMQRMSDTQRPHVGGEAAQDLDTWAPARATVEQQRELLDSLSILQRSPRFAQSSDDGPLDLRQKLNAAWRSAGLEVGPDHHMMLDIVSNLLDAIMDDPFVNDTTKIRVRRLAIPILKVAFQDQTFFEDQMHPARQVLDHLGRLDSESSEQFTEVVDPVVNGIIESYEKDPAVFSSALIPLKSAVSKQTREFQENLEQLVSEREAQQEFLKSRLKDPEKSVVPPSRPAMVSPGSGDDSDWERWLNEARRCKPGDVLSVEGQQGKRNKLSLAWVSEDGGTFVLVNSLGKKVMSLTVQELAMQMRRGSAVAEDIANMALSDRGTYRMLRSLHKQLAMRASHDKLTELLTRKEFEARLDEAITDAVRTESCHVMYALDVEGFKPIVKKAGKKVGKELLKKLAKLLEKQVAHRGAVARLGTSRFAVLLNNVHMKEGCLAIERQRETIAKTRCMWRGEVFPLTVSAGVLEITNMNGGVEATINAVECALQRAADQGGNRIEPTGTVDEPMDTDGILGAGESTILDMLSVDSLRLRCQKVIPVAENGAALPHYEILLGVQKGDGHVKLPADFLRAAERNHQMGMVDRWVISSVFAWIGENGDKTEKIDGYSINLSADSMSDEDVLGFVLEKFSETMVPPAKIIFEFRESAATENISLITDFVTTLKAYGCRFAIDDFGMADHSFSYLSSLPVDFVKINGKLVVDILSNTKDLAVVRSINEIGHLLGKQTIAGFVENDKILARIRELGIDYAQGYGIEKPGLLSSL